MPLVSLINPADSAANLIGRTLPSASAQSLRDAECTVTDAEARFWVASGADSLAQRRAEGLAPRIPSPAFLSALSVATALQGMGADDRVRHPHAGMTFRTPTGVSGQAEHQVRL